MCGTGTIEDVCIQREVETHYFGEEKLKMEFVHIELKRDTWSKPVKHVKNPEEAVDVIKKILIEKCYFLFSLRDQVKS